MDEIERIENLLLEEPSIDACVVLERQCPQSARIRIAYVVSSTSVSSSQLVRRLQALEPDVEPPSAYVPINAIPLDTSGKVDEQALGSLPVIDDDVASRWQAQLERLPEIDRVTVLVQEKTERSPPLHLDTMLADWRDDAAETGAGTPGAAKRRAAPRGETGSRVPAISHGSALRDVEALPATLADCLDRAARGEASRGISYVEADGSSITQSYSELLERAERVLAGLQDRGIRAGDKVIFQLRANRDFIEAFWACTLGGIIPVPVSIAPTYSQLNATISKLHNAWKLLGRPLLLTDGDLAGHLRALPELVPMSGVMVDTVGRLRECASRAHRHQCRPDDAAIFLLTSGSTGTPKAVIQTHRSLVHRSAASAQMNRFSERDISLNWFPLDHVGGIVMFHLRDVFLGCQQIHAQTEDILQEPLKWLDLIERHKATITWAPNFAFGLVNARADDIATRSRNLSSMRFILNGGEAIVAKTARRFMSLLEPHGLPPTAMHPAWGMSETSSGVTYSSHFSLASTSDDDPFVEVGSPIPRVSIRIVDSKNKIVREGETGLLQISGATVTTGYYDNPRLNRESFTRDGWFKTGDLGFLRDGRLTITGREKDVVIINGVNYYSHEIESAVEGVPGVETSYTAACAVHDPGITEDRLAIFFHPTADGRRSLRELLQEIRGTVARSIGVTPDYLVPAEIDDIPKTSIGKIQRAQLVKRFESGEFAPVSREVDVLLENANTLPSWFHKKIWRPKEASLASPEQAGGVALIFEDDHGLGDALGELLTGHDCSHVSVRRGSAFRRMDVARYEIRTGAPEDYEHLLAALASDGIVPNRILHLWTYRDRYEEPGSLQELELRFDEGAHSLLHLLAALDRRRPHSQPIRMHVVGSSTQQTVDGEPIDYIQAPVLGIVKSAAQELPWLHSFHVDLARTDSGTNAALVLRELTARGDEREVAYRDGRRLVPRLEEVEWTGLECEPLPLRRGGTYLLSGGLGGVAVELARFLLVNYGARLILVGRSALMTADGDETKAEFDDEHLKRYRALEELDGEVVYEAADIADHDRLRQIVERATDRWHTTLDGIFHLAGIYRENMLVDEDRESFDRVLHAKTVGTLSLYDLLRDQPRSFFVGFSSATTYFGGATVGAYSAANTFLEHFMRHHDATKAPRCYSFSWTAWEGLGISRHFEMKHLLDAHGYQTMSPEQALRSLLAGMRSGHDHLLIGLDGSNRHVRRHLEAPPRSLRQAVAYVTFAGEHVDLDALREIAIEDRFGARTDCTCIPLEDMPLTENGAIDVERLRMMNGDSRGDAALTSGPRTETERVVADLWREILSVPKVNIADNFFELGGDSLLAVQLLSRIREELHVELSVRSLFEAASLADLAELIVSVRGEKPRPEPCSRPAVEGLLGEKLSATIEQLSEEEVDALLSQMAKEESQADGR